ncbi:MAG: hypothetical protein HC799_03495 [Limnothrix sp. RL_2_0]|nr:hypothetical protein [Limnothrix sp. RL_2_0]
MDFSVDLNGRVQNINLPASKALLPVFEAIINSIQAIEDRKINTGYITVKLIRRNEQSEFIGENSVK